MDEMITMRKKDTRTLLWYYANDQKTKLVNEIKCCDCFFDIMLVFKEGFLDLIDENDDNEIPEKTFLDFCLEVDTKDQDVYQDDYQIHRFHELSRIHFWAV